MSILVVGSVAFDTVETPFGKAEKVLGGSASFFAVAASFFAPVNLVGVVGDDFGEKELRRVRRPPHRPRRAWSAPSGETFHWQGKYSYDLNSRDTIRTDLNVFESFKPKIPERYRHSEHVFLGNIDPVLQRDGPRPGGEAEAGRLRHHELLDLGQAGRAAQTLRAGRRPADQRRRGAPALGRVEHRQGGARHPRAWGRRPWSSRRASTAS